MPKEKGETTSFNAGKNLTARMARIESDQEAQVPQLPELQLEHEEEEPLAPGTDLETPLMV